MALPPIPTQAEAIAAMYGTWRLLLGDRSGLSYFAASEPGFWRASWVLAAVLPLNILIFLTRSTTENGPDASLGGLAMLIMAVVIAWFGYALAANYALPALDRDEKYFDYMIPEFWSSLPIIFLQFIAIGLAGSGLLPGSIGTFLTVASLGTELWLRAQIIRLSLDLSYGVSAALVVAGLLFHALIAAVFTRAM
jgi:hypothetical protein